MALVWYSLLLCQMANKVSLITLNCQGLRTPAHRDTLFSCLNCFRPTFVCLQETHSVSEREFSTWIADATASGMTFSRPRALIADPGLLFYIFRIFKRFAASKIKKRPAHLCRIRAWRLLAPALQYLRSQQQSACVNIFSILFWIPILLLFCAGISIRWSMLLWIAAVLTFSPPGRIISRNPCRT